jgi:2-oxo-3-hexenedioate decarboxylase
MTPEAILDHCDRAALWPAERSTAGRSDLAAAYQDALALRALRLKRGERPVGYKIGFTNRTIWERYGVYGPIWGPVWNTTLTRCDGRGTVDLAGTIQPRLEPEIVFGIAATPPRDATLEQVFACVEWLAPGFEIVQSHCAGWKFTAAETVADGALHALRHFVQELRNCPGAPELQPGDVVTTGTWTDAWPIAPGQAWRTEFEAPFESLEIALR